MRAAWIMAVLVATVLAPLGASSRADRGPEAMAPEPSSGCRAGTLAAAVAERGEVDGRAYLLDAPAAPADRALPVILAFHGFLGAPATLRAGAGFAGATGGDAIVVYPAGHDGVRLLGTVGVGWDLRPDQTTDRDFVRHLIDHLEARRCVDRRRIYATGMSNGGFLASLLGCQMADRLAAVAAVAGGRALDDCKPARPMPVLFLYGSADAIVPPGMVREGVDWWVSRNACGAGGAEAGCTRWTGCVAPVAACEGAQGHRWPPDAASRIRAFFRQHAREEAGKGAGG